MQCFHPIKVRLPTGVIQQVSCGHCFACQSNRRKDWYFRIKSECEHSVCSYTVTLTYSDDYLPALDEFIPCDEKGFPLPERRYYYHPLRIKDLQDFHKRLRKHFSFRFFGIGEYGSHTGRPHYHIIYFFQFPVDKRRFEKIVFDTWKCGNIKVDRTSDSSIEYCLKYCLKPYYSILHQPQPKLLCSKRPYIGSSYMTGDKLNRFWSSKTDIANIGYTARLPRIYREKYFKPFPGVALHIAEELQNHLIDSENKLSETAASYGMSVDEYKSRQRSVFVNKCLDQIKKKQL